MSGDLILEVRGLYLLALHEHQKRQDATRPARTRHAHALSAYILAVAAVEASVNEIFLGGFARDWLFSSTVIHELRDSLERQDLIAKLLILPELALGKRLSTGRQPIQDMNTLNRLRNELVHYKMSGKTPGFIRDLAQRTIAIQPPSGEGETISSWVPMVSTMEGIAWAHNTACRTVRTVIELFSEEKRNLLVPYSENFAESEELTFR